MRATCLLRRTFDVSEAQERGFSNCTSGKEELEVPMRDALRLSVTSTTATKSNKAADLASLGRRQFVPTKCESPASPSSVSLAAETRDEPADDISGNVSQA